MSKVDLNKLAERLREERPVGVRRDGKLTQMNPDTDRTYNDSAVTNLEPKRFFN